MPDRRRHRGPHPSDRELFGEAALPALREAVADLSWLLGRGYADASAVQVVGNRYGLTARQRMALARAACAEDRRAARLERRVEPRELGGRPVALDGFNCLITLEAALSGGVVLVGRDRAHRDLASVHGSWRRVEETVEAARRLGRLLTQLAPADVLWLLDQPVSNSGRLKALLAGEAERHGWKWRIEVVPSPDRALAELDAVVATSDSGVLDRARAWVDLPGEVIASSIPEAWVVDLAGGQSTALEEPQPKGRAGHRPGDYLKR